MPVKLMANNFYEQRSFKEDGEQRGRANLFVENLPNSMTAEGFRDLVQPFGKLSYFKFLPQQIENKTAYGFVSYSNPNETNQALKALNSKVVNSHSVRASFARPETQVLSTTNLYICGLPLMYKSEQLKDLFSSFGPISETRVLNNTVLADSKGVGFVHFQNPEDAAKAVSAMNGTTPAGISGPLIVKFARDVKKNSKKIKFQDELYPLMHDGLTAPPCKYFQSGKCNRGNDCNFSHVIDETMKAKSEIMRSLNTWGVINPPSAMRSEFYSQRSALSSVQGFLGGSWAEQNHLPKADEFAVSEEKYFQPLTRGFYLSSTEEDKKPLTREDEGLLVDQSSLSAAPFVPEGLAEYKMPNETRPPSALESHPFSTFSGGKDENKFSTLFSPITAQAEDESHLLNEVTAPSKFVQSVKMSFSEDVRNPAKPVFVPDLGSVNEVSNAEEKNQLSKLPQSEDADKKDLDKIFGKKNASFQLNTGVSSSSSEGEIDNVSNGISKTNLYVSQFPRNWTSSDLEKHFSPFGKIEKIRILTPENAEKNRGVGFVHFTNSKNARNAMFTMQNFVPKESTKPIIVKFANQGSKSFRNIPSQAGVCKFWIKGECARGEMCSFKHHTNGVFMPIESFSLSRSQRSASDDEGMHSFKKKYSFGRRTDWDSETDKSVKQSPSDDSVLRSPYLGPLDPKNPLFLEKKARDGVKKDEKERYEKTRYEKEKEEKNFYGAEEGAPKGSFAEKKPVQKGDGRDFVAMKRSKGKDGLEIKADSEVKSKEQELEFLFNLSRPFCRFEKPNAKENALNVEMEQRLDERLLRTFLQSLCAPSLEKDFSVKEKGFAY